MKFEVIDLTTGKQPDLQAIALKEDWAKPLAWTRMDGFAIQSDGTLILTDRCGNHVYCPIGRFRIDVKLNIDGSDTEVSYAY